MFYSITKFLLTSLFIYPFLVFGSSENVESSAASAPVSNKAVVAVPRVIIISKETMDLKVYDDKGKLMMRFPMACGLNYGNKVKKGDMKTPEGVFKISEIRDASSWSHDFKDGKGVIKNAYGKYFIRLVTPGHTGIGIHGTHAPESIGTRASEGCIRLENSHLDSLVAVLNKTERVVILPGTKDVLADQEIK